MQVQKSFKGQSSYGTLYLVPTPIGNLQDMTFRSVQILKEVDLICAEDTRNTGLLLKHFEIETKQYSFHEHNAYEKIPDLLERLKSGLSWLRFLMRVCLPFRILGMIWSKPPLLRIFLWWPYREHQLVLRP